MNLAGPDCFDEPSLLAFARSPYSVMSVCLWVFEAVVVLVLYAHDSFSNSSLHLDTFEHRSSHPPPSHPILSAPDLRGGGFLQVPAVGIPWTDLIETLFRRLDLSLKYPH